MEIVKKLGGRPYIFFSEFDLNKAIDIYSQNTNITLFEEELDKVGIDWIYDMDGDFDLLNKE